VAAKRTHRSEIGKPRFSSHVRYRFAPDALTVPAMKHSTSPVSKRKPAIPLCRPTQSEQFGSNPDTRFTDYFRELPGMVRETRVQIANAPGALRHLADAIDQTMNEFSLDSGGEAIEAVSVQIRANVVAAASMLVELAMFAGQLAEVAREAEVMVDED
jgi:hypothetical protein